MDDRVLENHVTKWIKSTQVINNDVKRLEEDERKAYNIILATFEKKRPNMDAISTNCDILKGYLEGGVKDDLYTAVRDFVKISNPIAIENFDAFKDFLEDKGFFGTKTSGGTPGFTGNSMGTAEYRREVIDGDIYEGMFLGNDRVWKGKITYANGEYYEGEWSNKGAYGEGVFIEKNGTKRIGRFMDNGEGKGKIEYPDNTYYEGGWNNNGRNGYGKTVTQERVDEGEYKNDARVGSGKISWNNGNWYKGGWNDVGPNGFGTWKTGTRVDKGEYKNSVRVGKGRMEWEDGDWYEGEWNDNGANGQGTTKVGTRIDKGQYKDGKRTGSGYMEWENGNWYKGEWNENGKNGHGVQFIKEHNRTDDGSWNEGNECGNTLMKWNDGNWYMGTWSRDSQGRLNGIGHFYTQVTGKKRAGKYVDGTWKNDWNTTRNILSVFLWVSAIGSCAAGSWIWGIVIAVIAWKMYEGT